MKLKNIIYAVYRPGITFPPSYIGVGKKASRAYHSQFGPTHVRQAKEWMKLHHLGYVAPLEVLIIEAYETYDEASNAEFELIEKLQPEWNIQGTEHGIAQLEKAMLSQGKGYKKILEINISNLEGLDSYNRNQCNNFIRALFNGEAVNRKLHEYEALELTKLASVKRTEKVKKKQRNIKSHEKLSWQQNKDSVIEELTSLAQGCTTSWHSKKLSITFLLKNESPMPNKQYWQKECTFELTKTPYNEKVISEVIEAHNNSLASMKITTDVYSLKKQSHLDKTDFQIGLVSFLGKQIILSYGTKSKQISRLIDVDQKWQSHKFKPSILGIVNLSELDD